MATFNKNFRLASGQKEKFKWSERYLIRNPRSILLGATQRQEDTSNNSGLPRFYPNQPLKYAEISPRDTYAIIVPLGHRKAGISIARDPVHNMCWIKEYYVKIESIDWYQWLLQNEEYYGKQRTLVTTIIYE